ncbi:ARM repeat-containing protein [Nadsonia fulvescens var. elongata DSM 6958]|uniref:ARM repeat-containing protein n=1 Tax=Nadsonia fulvescens var. elongata DSM 6958 TaxID=857566 RepID=A0A1E3PEX2_9ASCO|nr:ARM repeat-containing protein [Nadsonia fulvescens var. elongata DSM 6958]
MDKDIQKGLNDKLYDKRKSAALELEHQIHQCVKENNRDKLKTIIDQLCRDFAYAVHHPNARNGGLIGLAAAAIALGQNEVALYLDDIIHPVLACFADQDARVRYYACESMYNIAKVAKGEILLYFNEIFDALCKLSADSEISVKNGADLLDRLIKDIVSEKAATYVSIIPNKNPSTYVLPPASSTDITQATLANELPQDDPTAFSLRKFIPLLMERIYVLNPFTRMFLVSWISLLDSIPDLEMVSYLPFFLGGLIGFLSDARKDVRVATHAALESFLQEIKRVAEIKRLVAQARLERDTAQKTELERDSSQKSHETIDSHENDISVSEVSKTGSVSSLKELSVGQISSQPQSKKVSPKEQTPAPSSEDNQSAAYGNSIIGDSNDIGATVSGNSHTISIGGPGDSIRMDDTGDSDLQSHEIIPMLEEDKSNDIDDEGIYIPGQDVHIDYFKIIEILISHLDSSEEVQLTVIEWIKTLLTIAPQYLLPFVPRFLSVLLPIMAFEGKALREAAEDINNSLLSLIISLPDHDSATPNVSVNNPSLHIHSKFASRSQLLDYSATVNSLTLHFLNEQEQTRVAALDWLIMLHRKTPKKMLAINDGTFPALLKTLSDPSEQVVTRDLQLLAQISHNSDDGYFALFMHNLLNLFSTDRRLLETRGNLIIRQLCVSLNPERIYRTLAEILERDDDTEFASIMVENLNSNLISAQELIDLRKRLKALDTKEGASFFVSLFKCWCHDAPAAFSLCLLAQAYEHAFAVLQIFIEFEITVNLLIQIDKLVQLLESPVFTHLRLQLLEPEKYPYLYKCLYGILMLLPQSSAFTTLRNRLNSVSSIGYIHIPSVRGGPSTTSSVSATASKLGSVNQIGKKSSDIKWADLLDAFRNVQQKHENVHRRLTNRKIPGLSLSAISTMNADSNPQLDDENINTRLQGTSGGSGNSNNNIKSSGSQEGHVGSYNTGNSKRLSGQNFNLSKLSDQKVDGINYKKLVNDDKVVHGSLKKSGKSDSTGNKSDDDSHLFGSKTFGLKGFGGTEDGNGL